MSVAFEMKIHHRDATKSQIYYAFSICSSCSIYVHECVYNWKTKLNPTVGRYMCHLDTAPTFESIDIIVVTVVGIATVNNDTEINLIK